MQWQGQTPQELPSTLDAHIGSYGLMLSLVGNACAPLCIVNLAPYYASRVPLLPSETRRFKWHTMVSVNTHFLVVLLTLLLCLIPILYHLTWPVFLSLLHRIVASHKESGIILSHFLVTVVESSDKNKKGRNLAFRLTVSKEESVFILEGNTWYRKARQGARCMSLAGHMVFIHRTQSILGNGTCLWNLKAFPQLFTSWSWRFLWAANQLRNKDKRLPNYEGSALL